LARTAGGTAQPAMPCRTALFAPAVPDPLALLLIDVNRDGSKDLVAVGSGAVALYLHDGLCGGGGGTFGSPIALGTATAVQMPTNTTGLFVRFTSGVLYDINFDGLVDVVVALEDWPCVRASGAVLARL
jgi:hypothetical protein